MARTAFISATLCSCLFSCTKGTVWHLAMAEHRTSDNSGEIRGALAQLAQVYSTCKTYEDQGVVRDSMPDEDGRELVTEDFFTTAFDRSAKRFRFEFRTGSPQTALDQGCIVWRNGDSVKMWTKRSTIRTPERIGLAIAGAVGSSAKSAFLIPNLLAPEEIEGRGLLDLDDLRLVGKAEFNDSDCVKISGCYSSGIRLTVWVEVNTSLILKAEEETAMTLEVRPQFHNVIMGAGPLVTKTTITYSPRVNTSLPTAKFEMLVPDN